MKGKAGPKPEAKHKPARAGRLKQIDLITDREVPALVKAAEEYAEIRDERQALTLRESKLKETVRKAMHDLGKKVYKHGHITITLEDVAEEKVTVKIDKNIQKTDSE